MILAVVMILRLYAIYNRSRVILAILLVPYIAQTIVLFIINVLYSFPRYTIGTDQMRLLIHAVSYEIPCSVNCADIRSDSLLCRAHRNRVERCVHDHPVHSRHYFTRPGDDPVRKGITPDVSNDTKMAVEQIHADPPQGLLFILLYVRLLFFLTCILDSFHDAAISAFLNNFIYLLYGLGDIPQGWVYYVLLVVANLPLYALTPRFVMNIRELYALDIEGRRGGDIDAGFGLSSRESRGVGSTTIGTIVFMELGVIGGPNDDEETVVAGRGEGREQQ